MIGLTTTDMNRAYADAYKMVQDNGHRVSPRSLNCIEVRPAYLTLTRPAGGLYAGKSRRLNYRFFAIETLSYIAGWGDEVWHADLLCGVNSQMKRFRNKQTGLFDGAYGPRLVDGLRRCYSSLRHDPDTRQAVASIWGPQMKRSELDTPCTLNLNFYRDVTYKELDGHPRLGMTAAMRSNDLNWGTPYDVAAFCAIQCLMAGALGWKVGDYNHVANSLHFYEEHPPTICDYEDETWLGFFIPDLTTDLYRGVMDWGDVCAGAVLFLKDAHEHWKSGQPWSAFVSSLELRETHKARHKPEVLATFWSEWARLVRWTWCDNA